MSLETSKTFMNWEKAYRKNEIWALIASFKNEINGIFFEFMRRIACNSLSGNEKEKMDKESKKRY